MLRIKYKIVVSHIRKYIIVLWWVEELIIQPTGLELERKSDPE